MTTATLIEIFDKAYRANKAFVNSTGSLEFVDTVAFSQWYQISERVKYVNAQVYKDSLAMIRKMYAK